MADKDPTPPPSPVSAHIRSHPERNKRDKLEDEIEFLERPSKEFECPVCLQVMTKPVLTSCCGHHFCQACIDHAIARNQIHLSLCYFYKLINGVYLYHYLPLVPHTSQYALRNNSRLLRMGPCLAAHASRSNHNKLFIDRNRIIYK